MNKIKYQRAQVRRAREVCSKEQIFDMFDQTGVKCEANSAK